MTPEHKRFMDLINSPSAKAILADFFRARYNTQVEQLAVCGEAQFKSLQGKAQELKSLLDLCSK